jgi:hypothetical protein
MKNAALKLPVLFVILVFSALSFAGDCNVSSGACTPANCPPGCCTPAECEAMCGQSCDWDMSQWKNLRYDADGDLSTQLSSRQARNVARQYLAKCGIEGRVKVLESDSETYTLVVRSKKNEAEQKLQVSRRNGWVRPLSV